MNVAIKFSKWLMLFQDLCFKRWGQNMLSECLRILVRVIEPMVPHLAEERWSLTGSRSLTVEPWLRLTRNI